jgi:hypothetical protein
LATSRISKGQSIFGDFFLLRLGLIDRAGRFIFIFPLWLAEQ